MRAIGVLRGRALHSCNDGAEFDPIRDYQMSADIASTTALRQGFAKSFLRPSHSSRPAAIIAQPFATGNALMRGALLTMIVATLPTAAFAEDPAVDKSGFTLFNPTPEADMRAFSTDRPPKANSPYTVDAGHFQYETDVAVFGHGNNEGVRTQSWTVFDPTLKLGLTNTIDGEVQITPYESVATTSAGSTTSMAGIGDTFARLKFNFVGDDVGDFAAAAIPYIKIPTARSGLGNNAVEGGVILPMSINAPRGFTVIVMPEVDYLKDANDSGYHAVLDFLVNVNHPITDRWTVYTELFTSQPLNDEPPVYTLDGAFTYLARPNLQWDFGANYSLNGVGPRIQLYVGLSQRF